MYIEEIKGGDQDDNSCRNVVVLDAKRVLVGAGARALFYPTLLYNVLRNKIQSEFRWWDRVDQVWNKLFYFILFSLSWWILTDWLNCFWLFPVYIVRSGSISDRCSTIEDIRCVWSGYIEWIIRDFGSYITISCEFLCSVSGCCYTQMSMNV